jgi:ComF family protein
MLSKLLDLVFPPRCVACRTLLKHDESLCNKCRSKITLNTTFFCGECRLRISKPRPSCHPDFPYILGAATEYQGPVKKMVHALKFDLLVHTADELGLLLVNYAAKTKLDTKDRIIVPIPLSKQRERERGFNQAKRIAEVFASHLDLPLVPGLQRTRHTPAQSKTTSLHERRTNLARCFKADKNLVSGQDILLIDDVVTSGVTLKEAALALKKAGAGQITAMVCAKA